MASLSDLLANEGFKKVKPKKSLKLPDYDSISLPIYICHNQKNFNPTKHKKTSSTASSTTLKSDEPAIDEIATKAVISILSSYAGKYLKHKPFRDSLREKCCSCSVLNNRVLADLELGIESIEKLIDNPELKTKSLRNSIGFLTIVVDLNDSDLSACAQIYLSIVYKLEKKDRICAKHVLQVFVISPQLARMQLLPDLWEHLFLPHLLHIKIWYHEQIEKLSGDYDGKDEYVKELRRVYEDQMDVGTVKFAVYYKDWLKIGGQANATLPSVPLPSVKLLSSSSARRRRSSSFNNFINRAIFGLPVSQQPSTDFDYGPMEQKEVENVILTRAISTISSSQALPECETAIRVMTNEWLDNQSIEKTLFYPSVIQGMLQVLFASNNEEILELVISLLTEFLTRNESNRNIVLNLDPQLEGFMNLMKNSNLFLKAASLLHLVKPEAQQMVSVEWIPLVLRVLEFGDQIQTLFSVRCSPKVAAYYFLDQLLNGFDQDRNLENGREVISLGGLSLLLRRMSIGDNVEKTKVVSVIYHCIQADGRCRHYLVDNLNTVLVLEILVQNKDLVCNEIIFFLLLELICLHRFEQRTKLFVKLLKGLDCLNTMQILLVSLQRAKREKRVLIAAIMFQLDLKGDPLKCSVYRDEAIDVIIEALDPQICNEEVQEHAAKALLILGSRYAYTGTPEIEKWILKEAGYNESLEGGFHGRYFVFQESKQANEDSEIEHWQRKSATALWMSGGKRLMGALGESIANGIPCLARASLVTVAWLSKFVHTVGDGDVLQSTEFSSLMHRLTESLSQDNTVEERVLASFSLLSLSKSPGNYA